jgi:hypothetical protein
MSEPTDLSEPVQRRRRSSLPGPVLTPVQARAAVSVRREVTRAMDDGETVPCVADPASWDVDRPPSRECRSDLARVVRLCLTGCPVLERCRAFLATDPPTAGVCAGVYRPHADEPRAGQVKAAWAAAVAAELGAGAGGEVAA